MGGFDATGDPRGREEATSRRAMVLAAILNPGQLATVVVVPLFVVGRHLGFIADVPLWLLLASLVAAQIGSSVAYACWPTGSARWQVDLRIGVMFSLIGLNIYLTGWGATLAIGFVFGAAENIRVEGSRATRPAIVWLVVLVAAGEIGIALHWLPTLLPVPEVHGLAALATIGSAFIVALLGWTTRAKERVEESLRASEERFRALVQHASDVIMVVDATGRISYASPSLERVLGYAPGTLRDVGSNVVHPDDLDRVRAFIDAVARRDDDREVSSVELQVRHRDGSWHWFEVGVTNRLADPSVRGLVCNMHDVTERRRFEDQLGYLAYHDALTRLPNRGSFLEQLEAALGRSARGATAVAVLFLDVDRFKLVNDSLGHEVGDRLLVEVAARLRASVRPGDTVARFGGDEFTVLLEPVASPADAIRVADRVIEGFRAPVCLGGREVFVTSSIGIAVSERGETGASDLLRQADLAMYLAKEQGRSRWQLFDAMSAPQVVERLELEGDLWRALDRGELVVHFQPEVSLATGRVLGAEALVRWQHPRRGLLHPAAFVPVAEESALVVEIDRYVLREACRWAGRWQRSRAPGDRPVVGVNLSPRFVRQPGAVDEVTAVVRAAGIDPRGLQLEITERTALTDVAHTVETVREWRSLGSRVAIDDFGTGYSSLGYLKRLPVDVLKLDCSLVESMDTVESDLAIVQAVVTMGHALGMQVTAEGVERAEQAARLRRLGCDSALGWHWARALPPEAFSSVLDRGFVDAAATVLPFPGREESSA